MENKEAIIKQIQECRTTSEAALLTVIKFYVNKNIKDYDKEHIRSLLLNIDGDFKELIKMIKTNTD